MSEQRISREDVEKAANDDSFGWAWPRMARALLAADDALRVLISEVRLGITHEELLAAVIQARAAMLPVSEEVKDAN